MNDLICQTHWKSFGQTEGEGDDHHHSSRHRLNNTAAAGASNDNVNDGSDDSLSNSHTTNSNDRWFVTWPLDPLPFTGIPVEKRPMKLY